MLNRLYINNFALIDRLEMELHAGVNVLTGETGAGKSIIIDAVDIVIGGQGLTEFIRSGEEKALVEGVFDLAENDRACEILIENGLLPEPGEALILTRELNKNGKNTCRINGRQVNLSLYREIAGGLVDIYGQHHQQSLLDPQKHVRLLDEFGGANIAAVKSRLAETYGRLMAAQSRLRELESMEREQSRTADMYRYQYDEIQKSGLTVNEDKMLEEERNILAHAERLALLTRGAYQAVYEGSRDKAVVDLLHDAIQALREAVSIDEAVKPMHDSLEASMYQIEEAAREINGYFGRIEANPQRLEEVETRLDLIKQLKKKYGATIEEILAYRDQVASSLELINNFDQELASVQQSLVQLTGEYERADEKLTAARQKAADNLRSKITAELKELNMPYVTFGVQVSPREAPAADGTAEFEFVISPNKGEPLKPLVKIVSGGEVSRIMLAFKAILARIDSVDTLIFDEVDAGIGGEALGSVATKLSVIGRDRQVVCVTHSPQIAGCCDTHYRIEKVIARDRTVTRVRELGPAERLDEIARMLAGGNITPVSKKHAEELLNSRKLV